MMRLLPALHEGHAPIYLHQAFEDALEAYAGWSMGESEPTVLFEGREIAVSHVFGRMRQCSDLLPERMLLEVRDLIEAEGWTLPDGVVLFADAAFVLRALCVKRLRDMQPAGRPAAVPSAAPIQ